METNSGTVVGTCQQMCSRKEMLMREREGLLHPFEVLNSDERDPEAKSRPKADPSKTIKQFSRPAAGRTESEPSDLRPAPVLRETVNYLYESIIPKEHPAWTSVYEFVFDRLRAVRQDMVIQGITGTDAVRLLEQVVRFHLYASYRLRASDVSLFDPVINSQHLLECLKRLLYLYQVTPGHHENRAEFESVYLLSNLGDVHARSHFLELEPEIRRNQLIRQCYEISTAFVLRNYTRVLRLLWRLPCAMCLCAVSPHLDILRGNYLQILSSGYSIKNCRFPTSILTQLLHLDTDEATTSLCTQCGLVDSFDNTQTDYICFSKSAFCQPKDLKVPVCLPVLDSLLQQASISSLLLGSSTGGTIGVKDCEKAVKNVARGRGRGRRE